MNYWLSWFHKSEYGESELHSPWWISGECLETGDETICAAVKAKDIEFRFLNQKEDGWIPFNDRFQKKEWMKW